MPGRDTWSRPRKGMATYECAVCGAPTDRGCLMLFKGQWVAAPLCADDKGAIVRVYPDAPRIDATRPN